MPVQPSRSDVHVNRPLTQISIAFFQDQNAFVADRVFPNIPVQKQSDRYFTYDRGEFNRDEMEERAPATESSGGTYTIDSTPTYYAGVKAYHRDVPDPVRDNADEPLQPDREATMYVTYKALLNREVRWVSAYLQPSTWTFDYDGVSGTPGSNEVKQWNDPASTPIEDVRFAGTSVQESTGFRPNVLVLGRRVFDKLVDHPDIVGRLDRGQTSGAAMANRQQLAALFEVEEVLVMEAIQNTAPKGAANAHSFIGGKRALLAYRTPTPGIMTPTAGYTFSWTKPAGSSRNGTRVSRFRMQHLKADRVEIEQAFDQKLISADLGFFWDAVVA